MTHRTMIPAALAFTAAFVVWSSVRWLALVNVGSGRAVPVFWVTFAVVATAALGLGLVRLVRSPGRLDPLTFWLVTAPVSLLVVPMASAIWLGYLLIGRRFREGLALPQSALPSSRQG